MSVFSYLNVLINICSQINNHLSHNIVSYYNLQIYFYFLECLSYVCVFYPCRLLYIRNKTIKLA